MDDLNLHIALLDCGCSLVHENLVLLLHLYTHHEDDQHARFPSSTLSTVAPLCWIRICCRFIALPLMTPEIAPLLEQVAPRAFVVLEEVVVSNLDLFVHAIVIV